MFENLFFENRVIISKDDLNFKDEKLRPLSFFVLPKVHKFKNVIFFKEAISFFLDLKELNRTNIKKKKCIEILMTVLNKSTKNLELKKI